MNNITRTSLWDYMKQYIDDVELLEVKDIIDANDSIVSSNEVLFNEVLSLGHILQDMIVHHYNATGATKIANEAINFTKNECKHHLDDIKTLLDTIDSDEYRESVISNFPNVQQLVNYYSRNQKVDDLVHEYENEYKNNGRKGLEHFATIDRIQREIANSHGIFENLNIILDAFSLETNILMEKTIRTRSLIDNIQQVPTDFINEASAYNKRALCEIQKCKKKLETIILSNGNIHYKMSFNRLCSINPQNEECEKENNEPLVIKHSKRRMRLKEALETAANIQSEIDCKST